MSACLLAVALLIPGGVPQPDLEEVVNRFAEGWGQEDVRALGSLMDPEGIRLILPGVEHALILPRHAQAALGAFLEGHSPGEIQITRISLAGGDPHKGFSELRWRTRGPGSSGSTTFTLFVAYAVDDDSWRVTEIRILF